MSFISKKSVYLSLPLTAIDFLMQDDYNGKSGKKTNKYHAFADLVKRCFIASIQGEETEQPYKQLMDAWGWTRVALEKFLANLEGFGMVETVSKPNKKFVKISPRILSETRENVSDGQFPARKNLSQSSPQNLNSWQKPDFDRSDSSLKAPTE